MNRFRLGLLAVGCLSVAGCEQKRPPTPEGLKLIKLRTAAGTTNTKVEAKPQPSPPVAGQVSVWDLKVFDIKDKPDGLREEWKFFNALPQSSNEQTTTGVLMNAWLISRDRSVFLPQKPLYKEYGSFLTDWTIPSSGPYTLWVEYQPVVAQEELSLEDFQNLKNRKVLPIEHAHWDFSASGTAATSGLVPLLQPGAGGELRLAAYSLDANPYGTRAPFQVQLIGPRLKANQSARLNWQVAVAAGQTLSDASFVALSPDGKTLVHLVGQTPNVSLPQKGRWRAWFSFQLDEKPFAASVDLDVS